LANFSEQPQTISALTLSALPKTVTDLISGKALSVVNGLKLDPYAVLWLAVPAQASHATI
jgi:amylosucrase